MLATAWWTTQTLPWILLVCSGLMWCLLIFFFSILSIAWLVNILCNCLSLQNFWRWDHMTQRRQSGMMSLWPSSTQGRKIWTWWMINCWGLSERGCWTRGWERCKGYPKVIWVQWHVFLFLWYTLQYKKSTVLSLKKERTILERLGWFY